MGDLREAEALAEEIGLPGELWQIRATLGELYQKSGDEEQAGRAFSRAVETVEALADTIEDEVLREGFLGAPQIQRLLES